MLLPLFFCVQFFSLYFIDNYQKHFIDSNQNTLSIYSRTFENELSFLHKNQLNLVSTDVNFKMLSGDLSELDAHSHSYEILSNYESLFYTSENLSSCMIISQKNHIFRSAFQENYGDIFLKEAIQ